MSDNPNQGHVELPSRRIPPPVGISDAAREALAMPRPAGGAYPALDDADGWRRLIAARDAASAKMSAPFVARLKASVANRSLGGVPACVATPHADRTSDEASCGFAETSDSATTPLGPMPPPSITRWSHCSWSTTG